LNAAPRVAFPFATQGPPRWIEVISEFDGWPTCAPVNASPALLPWPAHDSGSGWIATPFLCGSFIRYSLPDFTGAFAASPFNVPAR